MTPVALPAVIVHALRNPTPEAKDFTPTRFQPASNKAWFALHFLRFISSDCPKHQFTLRFYRQLIHCFGYIAFYAEIAVMPTPVEVPVKRSSRLPVTLRV